jgi:hypothetical protein
VTVRWPPWTQIRGMLLFALGGGLMIWDTTIYTPGEVGVTQLVAYGALMGLELVLRGDAWRRNGPG